MNKSHGLKDIIATDAINFSSDNYKPGQGSSLADQIQRKRARSIYLNTYQFKTIENELIH